METDRKRFYGLIVVIFMAILLLVFFIAHDQSFSSKIDITVAPTESHITLNGKTVHNDTVKVRPGTYKVTASLAGFTTLSKTITVKADDTASVGLVLVSDSSTTATWYSSHPEDEQIAEGISSDNNDTLAQQSVQNVPLIRQLPFIGPGSEFRIDYGSQPGADANNPTIYITAPTTQAQQDAVTWIKNQGYDPTKLDIQYVTAQP